MSLNETDCISDLILDEWLSGELAPATGTRLQQHVEVCVRCQLRKESFTREHAAFLAAAPGFSQHTRLIAARRRSTRAPAPLWLFGAAALVVVGWLGPRVFSIDPGATGVERTKGAAHLGFFIKRGGRVQRGDPTLPVHPGDRLRFTYSNEAGSYFALFNRDRNAARVYFPNERAAARLVAGYDAPLDFSVELDADLGLEHFYGVFCAAPFDVEPMRATLQRTAALELPTGCSADTVALRKEPAR